MPLGHGRPKGLPKTGGRKKGVPNRSKEFLLEIATKALGKAPLQELCDFYNDKKDTDPQLALPALKEICSYVYAKPKAIELTGPDGEQLYPPQPPPTNEERLILVDAIIKKDVK